VADVRVADLPEGYYSYIGSDLRSIPADQCTMNLENYLVGLPDSEYHRVVEHETGHTLGFIHEHTRKAILDLIDPAKALPYYQQWQGWTAQEVMDQVLTVTPESLLTGGPARQDSVMTYPFPGAVTYSGLPIPGGSGLIPDDLARARPIYPPVAAPHDSPPVEPPASRPSSPPSADVPVLVVGGPPASQPVHPSAPAVFAVDDPDGGMRVELDAAILGRNVWDELLGWEGVSLGGTIAGPDGQVMHFDMPGGKAVLGLHAAGRHTIQINYRLDRTLSVWLTAA
jgi:hypothetical protein